MRWHLTLLPAAALLLGVACGDGSDDTATTPASTEATPTPGLTGQPTADRGLPTPTPGLDTGIAVQVVSGAERFTPTLLEFKGLPQVELDINGQKQKGVLLRDLTAKVPAGSAGIVTIEGLRSDMQRVGQIRFPLSDIADNTLLVVTSQGHLDLVSGSIPQEQWLKVVTGIVLT